MVYTQKHPALFLMGVSMVAIGTLAHFGLMDGLINYLAIKKMMGEITTLSYLFGSIAIVVGLWHWFGKHKEGHLDYYLSTVAGVIFILAIAMSVRWFLAPFIAVLSKSMGPVMGAKYLHEVLGLNYIVLGILIGILIVNFLKVPTWAENGVRLSRLGLKTGVVLLGTLYSLAELQQLGSLSIVMVGFFVLGSVGIVLWMGARRHIPNSMAGVLSAGMGVCGVSATVAAAPVVQAKSVEIAYTIGTILLWGVGCMFLFPIIGNLLNMGYVQFGAWAGTGILNSAQVAGAALAYQPDGIETLKVAEIFNITRVLILPIIVVWLAIWYVEREENAPGVNLFQVAFQKFPIFVIGFLLMFALSSTGIFSPANHYKGKYFDNSIPAEKLLNPEAIATLKKEQSKVEQETRQAALARLIENRKVMSIEDENTLRGLINANILTKSANRILKKAHKAVRHTAQKIKKFRDFITWLFAFGLVGLGMQITFASIKQAGGQPLIIGGVVGTLKAVLSLIVVMLFVHETI
ncbi:MAG: putative sulfate exporter family transporter [Candidatus Parabeggiatoa sp. nov. 3]|nr:MAG: putative sulfate exporter family transporter [Gammaproteobacteria bacterium]RKZ54151.1 MAG: putative sulfate exporter family transporter [Gammaproteobacteria bacterium]HEW97200.1 putative sulfate exporter family transporter [Beggiatoa sp.]